MFEKEKSGTEYGKLTKSSTLTKMECMTVYSFWSMAKFRSRTLLNYLTFWQTPKEIIKAQSVPGLFSSDDTIDHRPRRRFVVFIAFIGINQVYSWIFISRYISIIHGLDCVSNIGTCQLTLATWFNFKSSASSLLTEVGWFNFTQCICLNNLYIIVSI